MHARYFRVFWVSSIQIGCKHVRTVRGVYKCTLIGGLYAERMRNIDSTVKYYATELKARGYFRQNCTWMCLQELNKLTLLYTNFFRLITPALS